MVWAWNVVCGPVVYTIRILQFNPAGYWDFLELNWISFPFQPDPDPVIQMK